MQCIGQPFTCLHAFLVLTAAVTQASLQSMLHKILTAGPSAFNITTILSQAAQLSNQGKQSVFGQPLCDLIIVRL